MSSPNSANGQTPTPNHAYPLGVPRSPTTSPGPGAMRKPNLPSPLSQMAAAGSEQQHPHHYPGALHPPAKKKVHISSDAEENNTPYYIHSGLDKHGSLQGWLRTKHEKLRDRAREPITAPIPTHLKRRPGAPKPFTPARPEQVPNPVSPPPDSDSDRSSLLSRLDGSAIDTESMDDDGFGYDLDDDEEDHHASSLSRHLAETAQGVREVSKELSRTRVHSRIQTVLIVTKARDNRLIALTRELALFLMMRKPNIPPSSSNDIRSAARNTTSDRGMIVYVDAQLRNSKRFDAHGLQEEFPQLFEPVQRRRSSSLSASSVSINSMASSWSSAGGNGNGSSRKEEGQLRYWTPEMCSNSPQLFDFVVTLGGDGTVLFTSWLFQRIVPPVLPFALGSLGFLTNFDFANYRKMMDKCIDEGIRVNLRMRFTCTVYRAVAPDASLVVGRHGKRKAIRRPGGEILINAVDQDGWEALEGGAPIGGEEIEDVGCSEKEILCFSTRPVEQFEVLNDLVVDRGPSPFVSFLEVFGDDHHLTTVQADGLTVSTPTGSTAYSLSAGGSLVHPGIPAMLMTPICPHTLSFRPMLLPDGMELRVCVPYNSRSTAWASFDGRGRVELKQGDHIKITASKYPFPTVSADKQSTDWFKSIQRTLRWNERERQKSFVVVEEDYEDGQVMDKDKHHGSDEEWASEEDEFDIDDRSGGALTPPPEDEHKQSMTEVDEYAHGVPSPPIMSARKMRHLVEEYRSGVQSPDRFASNYHAPPPISQRHLLEALATVEKELKRVELTNSEAQAVTEAEESDLVTPLPEDDIRRSESDATLAPPERSRPARRDSEERFGGRTPRQGRSRSRSAVRSGSRSGSPHVGMKAKAFAFFGHDDSQSELSDGEDR